MNTKRLIALLLSFTMTVSIMPGFVMADTNAIDGSSNPAVEQDAGTSDADGTSEESDGVVENDEIIDVYNDLPETLDNESSDLISYQDYDSELRKLVDKTVSSNDIVTVTSDTLQLGNGWYIVSGNTDIDSRLSVTGNDVHLIISDGVTFTVPKGIEVNNGHKLTIYGQSEQSGKIIVNDTEENNAGIGGSNKHWGTVVINGADIDVSNVQYGAGIGGGAQASGGTVTINAGKVNAVSTRYGSGIGGGDNGCGNVIINGGVITASSNGGSGAPSLGSGAAGIGGGYNAMGGNITITGGTITAIGGYGAAGIGRGDGDARTGSGTTITISGGVIYAPINSGDAYGLGSSGKYDADISISNEDDKNVSIETNGSIFGNVTFGSTFKDEDGKYYNGGIYDGDKYFRYYVKLTPASLAVSFDAGEGSGKMEAQKVEFKSEYTLPECAFAAPAEGNLEFAGWRVGDTQELLYEGDTITIDGDKVLTAEWDELYYIDSLQGELCNPSLAHERGYAEGAPVKLNVTPDEGCVFSYLECRYENGQTKISYEPEFVMESSDVSVRVFCKRRCFDGMSLELSGQIGVNFHVSAPDGADLAGAYVTFEGNKMNPDTHYPVTELPDGGHKATIYIAPYQMADKYKATLHLADGQAEELGSYSAQDYVDSIIGNRVEISDKDRSIVEALADYAYYSQQYLSVQNNWTIGMQYAEFGTHLKNPEDYDYSAVASRLKEKGAEAGGSVRNAIESWGYRLNFGSEISLSVRIKLAGGRTAENISVGGTTVKPVESDGYYIVSADGIKATELLTKISFTLYTGGATQFAVWISPMSFAYAKLEDSNVSPELKNLLCAMYYYAESCK